MAKKHVRKLKRYVNAKSKRDAAEQVRLLPWFKAVPDVENAAFNARARAHSHKGFHVGIGALLLMPDGSTRIVDGCNHKKAPGPRLEDDHCAEEDGLLHADSLLAEEIVGMVIVAPHQADDGTGYNLGVTISCKHCRRRFGERLARLKAGAKEALKPRTRLLFVNADNRTKRVELTVSDVLALCRKKDGFG